MFTKVFKGFFLKGFIDWISQWLTIEIWSTIIDDWIAFFFVVVEMATFGVRISSNPVGHRSDSVAFWIQRALQRPSSSDSIDVWRNNRATMASLRASHYSDFCFTKKNQKKNNENLHFVFVVFDSWRFFCVSYFEKKNCSCRLVFDDVTTGVAGVAFTSCKFGCLIDRLIDRRSSR